MLGAGSHSRIATRYGAVTPSDTVNYADNEEAAGVYVGTGGNVVLVKRDGTTVTFKNVANGQELCYAHIRVNNTNTTATDLVWFI